MEVSSIGKLLILGSKDGNWLPSMKLKLSLSDLFSDSSPRFESKEYRLVGSLISNCRIA